VIDQQTDPVLDFIEFATELDKEAAEARAEKDFQLWQTWKQNGKQPEHLEPLMKQIDPLIRRASNIYAGKVNIPRSAVHAEFQIQAINALDSFNPNRGASLGTHVTWHLKKGRRFITTYQNIGRIPETRIYNITTFQNARDELRDQLGRDPAAHELSDKLKWPVNQVSAMELELRKEVPTSTLQSDMSSLKPSRETEILRLIQYELTPEEKIVYEHLLGVNGKPQLKPGEIATRLNMSPSKVSRIKDSIGAKVKKYY
jgi:DNA-directed RNA polymerase specialized sigma subunit